MYSLSINSVFISMVDSAGHLHRIIFLSITQNIYQIKQKLQTAVFYG